MSSYYEKFIATGEVKCIDDEIPFEIPQGWEWEKLGNIASICGGKRIPVGQSLTTVNTGHKYIRVTDMKNHSVNSNDIHYITEDIYQKIKAYYISKEDLYITVAGTIGHIGEIPEEFDNANLTENANKIVFRQMDKKFLMYCLSSDVVQSQITAFITKVGQPKLAIMRIQNLLIPVPPLKEQFRIVNAINLTMPFVDRYESLSNDLSKLNISIFELLKKSILQEAIQGKLVPQIQAEGTAQELLAEIHKEKELLVKEGKLKKSSLIDSIIYKGDDNKYWEKNGANRSCIDNEIPFDIPSIWSWVRLNDICSFIHRGKSPKYSMVKKYPVVAQKCNQWSGFSIEKAKFIEPQSISSYKEEYFLQNEDLMWNSTGLGTLGRMAIYYEELNPYELAVADSHVTVIRPYKQYIAPEYLYYYFASNTVQSVIEEKSDGSTKQKELATKTVQGYLIPLPPLAEQYRIIQRIKSVTSIMRG